MTKLSAERKTAKYIRRKSKRNSLPKVQTNSSPFRWLIHTLALSPLLTLDLLLSSLLWLHTMVYQLTMYGVYLGLFIFCHATGEDTEDSYSFNATFISFSGLTHKLERTPPQSEVMAEPDCDTGEEGTENESGYLSDSDCDDD